MPIIRSSQLWKTSRLEFTAWEIVSAVLPVIYNDVGKGRWRGGQNSRTKLNSWMSLVIDLEGSSAGDAPRIVIIGQFVETLNGPIPRH
jgi:hypothetical protein